jgi:predicted ester cyclase
MRDQLVTIEEHKAAARRLVDEVFLGGNLAVLDELYEPRAADRARAWITPFRASFSDLDIKIIDLVGEGNIVVARLLCSGTHTGEWLGHQPTGRRFHRVPEVYFFHFTDGRIADAWGLEDTHRRLRQLGLR